MDTPKRAREVPSAGQAELSQQALGLFPKVVMQGELPLGLFPEMVQEQGKPVSFSKGFFKWAYSSDIQSRSCNFLQGVCLSTSGASTGRVMQNMGPRQRARPAE